MAMTITLRHENGKDRAECASFAQANAQLRRWSDNSHPTLGYDKIDFNLTDPELGLDYRGRYDLVHWQTSFADLGAHVSKALAYRAGSGKPQHMSEEQYAHALARYSPVVREQAASYLALVSQIC